MRDGTKTRAETKTRAKTDTPYRRKNRDRDQTAKAVAEPNAPRNLGIVCSSKNRLRESNENQELARKNPLTQNQLRNKAGKFADGVREKANGKPGRVETAPTGLESETWAGAFSKTKLESSKQKRDESPTLE
jgi:hypothetical protein